MGVWNLPVDSLPFHLLYSHPFQKLFWETYAHNGKAGEWEATPSGSVQLRQSLPMEAEPTLPAQILPSLGPWRWLLKGSSLSF